MKDKNLKTFATSSLHGFKILSTVKLGIIHQNEGFVKANRVGGGD